MDIGEDEAGSFRLRIRSLMDVEEHDAPPVEAEAEAVVVSSIYGIL